MLADAQVPIVPTPAAPSALAAPVATWRRRIDGNARGRRRSRNGFQRDLRDLLWSYRRLPARSATRPPAAPPARPPPSGGPDQDTGDTDKRLCPQSMATYILATAAHKLEHTRINKRNPTSGRQSRAQRPQAGANNWIPNGHCAWQRGATKLGHHNLDRLRSRAQLHNKYTIIILSHTIIAFEDSFAPPRNTQPCR